MTIAATSRAAYHGIQADGTEACQKAKILAAIKSQGPMTRREISVMTGIEPGAVAGRVNDLVKTERIVETEHKRPCFVTGRLAKEVRLP